MGKQSQLERHMSRDILVLRQYFPILPAPETEYRFHPKRRWRFDFAWPKMKLAVEVEGGTWSGGRHTRGGGFAKDCEKYNAAVMLGWRVLRFTSGMIKRGEALEFLCELMNQETER